LLASINARGGPNIETPKNPTFRACKALESQTHSDEAGDRNATSGPKRRSWQHFQKFRKERRNRACGYLLANHIDTIQRVVVVLLQTILMTKQTVAVILLLVTVGACNRTPEARRDAFMVRGKEYFAKANYPRAIVEFRNAAQATPKDPEPYYQLGLGFLAMQDYRTALISFRKALELNPNHVGAQLKIAQMKVNSGDAGLMKEAEAQLGTLLDGAPSNTDALDALALAQLKLADSETAAQTLDRALTQSPGDLTASVLLARTKLIQNDAAGAENVLKAACRNAPKSAAPARLLGEFYIAQRRLPDAETQLRQAVALESGDGQALLDLARVQLTQGKKQEAEQDFKRLATLDAYKSIYGVFLFFDGRNDDAIKEFERLVKATPGDRQLRTDLIFAYRTGKRTADIDKLIADALGKNPKDVDALLQRVQTLLDRKEYGKAEADLNEVLRFQPNSYEAHYRLAKLQQARGAVRFYRQELSEALRLNPALESVRVELAKSLIADNAPKAALDILDAAPSAQKGSLAILVQRNWALWVQGDKQQLRQGIDQGLARQKSVDLLIQDAAWKLREHNTEAARTAAEQALKADPANLSALTILTEAYKEEKKSQIAAQKVGEYAARQPNSAQVQDFYGNLLISERRLPEARAALLKAKSADPKFVTADLSLATVDTLEGKIDDGRKRLQAVISVDNGNTKVRMALGVLAELKGDKKDAIDQYRKVLEGSPEDARALNNLAYLLADYGNQPDEALKYAQKAVELSPNAPAFEDTLGWILYRKALYPQAIQYLERAASPSGDVVIKYHLAMAYAREGKMARGRATLDEALKQNSNVPEAVLARQVVTAQ
jgi:putative PEP-CTERM system TPR-repeat lipoprotein